MWLLIFVLLILVAYVVYRLWQPKTGLQLVHSVLKETEETPTVTTATKTVESQTVTKMHHPLIQEYKQIMKDFNGEQFDKDFIEAVRKGEPLPEKWTQIVSKIVPLGSEINNQTSHNSYARLAYTLDRPIRYYDALRNMYKKHITEGAILSMADQKELNRLINMWEKEIWNDAENEYIHLEELKNLLKKVA